MRRLIVDARFARQPELRAVYREFRPAVGRSGQHGLLGVELEGGAAASGIELLAWEEVDG